MTLTGEQIISVKVAYNLSNLRAMPATWKMAFPLTEVAATNIDDAPSTKLRAKETTDMLVERLLLSFDTGLSINLGLHTAAPLNQWQGCAHVALLRELVHRKYCKCAIEDFSLYGGFPEIQPRRARYNAKKI